ncbi:MAG: hypothetical protein FWG33_04835, partial [Oscillospiraceae bacterium]|nr:hypothetical protein [Oscillospiraceae bacterium]
MKKKVIALICAATILCGMIVPAAGNTSQPETKEANIFDVLEILKDMIGISKLDSVEMYDVNDDGVIDIFDALMILKGLVKLQTPVMILLAPREKITVTSSFNVTGM